MRVYRTRGREINAWNRVIHPMHCKWKLAMNLASPELPSFPLISAADIDVLFGPSSMLENGFSLRELRHDLQDALCSLIEETC